jgi:hypothetical protein
MGGSLGRKPVTDQAHDEVKHSLLQNPLPRKLASHPVEHCPTGNLHSFAMPSTHVLDMEPEPHMRGSEQSGQLPFTLQICEERAAQYTSKENAAQANDRTSLTAEETAIRHVATAGLEVFWNFSVVSMAAGHAEHTPNVCDCRV